jgi:hypothetical protein
MAGLESYLSQICGKLTANPAVADDIREELRGHLEEVVATYQAAGATPAEALAQALARFGPAGSLSARLGEVHRPECVWALRLRGAAAGLLLGGLLAVLLSVAGGGGPLSPLSVAAPAGPRLLPLLNGALLGAFVGSLAISRGGLFVGWLLGSLLWLVEATVCWVTGAMADAYLPGGSLAAFDGLLLSPVLGGLFSAAVGIVVAGLLSLTSRPLPEVR